ncbi:malate synthase [Nakamurella panacisegetis]|uniref:Malate synthase n=1 Tax=Nakamurella panacisegetis TaxID=1090615 RepID=A0A1H0K5E0_9ACTN|nr:malate synthase A [Nakamurella panacisegetis]SDO51099.1 malate synthase [Nakamurella panacisegetis]
MSISVVAGAPVVPGAERVLTPAALEFLDALHAKFGDRRRELLALRTTRRDAVAAGATLDFLPETAEIRAGDWTVAPTPAYLSDRRVEITGPTDRKMTINAMNSGAKVWLADMEDANTPHWPNVIDGQINLADAIRETITLEQGGKSYRLADGEHAVIVMRPRGWHLPEKHLIRAGEPLSGSLVDFGLYFFHNASELLARGRGPAFYLPKMESHLEARLWAEVFAFAEQYCGIPAGSVRATMLIETIWAAFEMDEFLYELRDYASGLNAGRWDYLFSAIKTFRDAGPDFVLPDRNTITMAAPFMKAYSDLLVATCHKRGAYAIGGMAAFIPSKDPAANEVAFAKVRADKTREADAGYEGSWVAHPGLVPVCREIFDAALGDGVNQLDKGRDAQVPGPELLNFKSLQIDGVTPVTEAGLRGNISVALEYLVTWLSGRGAVAIHHLMEDAATAEISRSQVWQWLQAHTMLDTGRMVTVALITEIADAATEDLADAWAEIPHGRNLLADARNLLVDLTTRKNYVDFLTLPAYDLIP